MRRASSGCNSRNVARFVSGARARYVSGRSSSAAHSAAVAGVAVPSSFRLAAPAKTRSGVTPASAPNRATISRAMGSTFRKGAFP